MSRRRRGWRRWLRRAVAAVLVLVIVATAALFLLLRASLPSYDGEATVAGLTGSVTVVRDRNAVPHIFAANLADAYRALGYVHAQDRFFQMEMNRRFGAGRLAEIVGEPALRVDRLVRTLGIHRQAEESLAVLSPDARAAFEAYGQGVNAWLADAGLDLPPELRVLRVAPEPWRPTDTAVWGQLMAMRLAANWRTEVLRARLTDRLTAEQLRDLWPRDPPGRSATLPDLAAVYRELDLDSLAQAIPKVTTAGSASNEWVVAGRHTENGKPLLANDPHLGFEAPGLWYLARIVTPELEIAGATVPGVPLTILGHNGRIAWGMTNTEADVQDLFVERLDPSDPGRYMTPEGSEPFAVRVEEIAVSGRDAPERLTVRSTRHGPVISDLGDRTRALAPEGHVLALAFTALEPGDTTAEALYRINRATNWKSFVAALSHYRAPMQNIAYADVDGSIGFYAPALVPIRRNGDGFMPMPGWTDDFEWTGFIPFAELPQSVNPAAGRIVNANNRLVGDRYPHDIAAEWRWSYRADRINELLDTTAPHTTRTFAAIQTDIVSQAAVELVPKLLEAARDATAPAGADARRLDEAFRILERWNGAMDRDSVEPLLYMAWLRALGPALYADELGDLASEYYGLRPLVISRAITMRPEWCDDVTTPRKEPCGERILLALDQALDLLEERLGDDRGKWRWGNVHRAVFSHPVFGRIPVLSRFTDIAAPTNGGQFTINRGFVSLTDGDRLFRHIHGPGYRAIYDLGALDRSLMVIATGQSGHPLSRFYGNLIVDWRDGRYLRLSGSKEELSAEAIGVLTLRPGG